MQEFTTEETLNLSGTFFSNKYDETEFKAALKDETNSVNAKHNSDGPEEPKKPDNLEKKGIKKLIIENRNFNQADVNVLCDTLQLNKTVQSLSLSKSKCGMDVRLKAPFQKILRSNITLNELNLSYCDNFFVSEIFSAFADGKSLTDLKITTLNISGVTLTRSIHNSAYVNKNTFNLDLLCKTLQTNQNFKKLIMQNMIFSRSDSEDINILLTSLSKTTAPLEEIEFSNSFTIDEDNINILCNLVKDLKTLQRATFVNAKISRASLDHLSEAMASNPNLVVTMGDFTFSHHSHAQKLKLAPLLTQITPTISPSNHSKNDLEHAQKHLANNNYSALIVAMYKMLGTKDKQAFHEIMGILFYLQSNQLPDQSARTQALVLSTTHLLQCTSPNAKTLLHCIYDLLSNLKQNGHVLNWQKYQEIHVSPLNDIELIQNIKAYLILSLNKIRDSISSFKSKEYTSIKTSSDFFKSYPALNFFHKILSEHLYIDCKTLWQSIKSQEKIDTTLTKIIDDILGDNLKNIDALLNSTTPNNEQDVNPNENSTSMSNQ